MGILKIPDSAIALEHKKLRATDLVSYIILQQFCLEASSGQSIYFRDE